jgi:hypothetical protein
MTSSPIILCRVKALYSFQGTEPTALSFNKGDSIDVLAQLDSGWWDGWYVPDRSDLSTFRFSMYNRHVFFDRCGGKRGWFPSNYVEITDEFSETTDAGQVDAPELGGLLSDRRGSLELQTQRISVSASGVPLDTKHHRLSFTGMTADDPRSLELDNPTKFDQQQVMLDVPSELPPGWRLQLTDNGHVFYNEVTGEVRHNLDLDDDEGSASESGEDDELIDRSERSQSRDENVHSVYSESMDEASVFDGSATPNLHNPMEGVTVMLQIYSPNSRLCM